MLSMSDYAAFCGVTIDDVYEDAHPGWKYRQGQELYERRKREERNHQLHIIEELKALHGDNWRRYYEINDYDERFAQAERMRFEAMEEERKRRDEEEKQEKEAREKRIARRDHTSVAKVRARQAKKAPSKKKNGQNQVIMSMSCELDQDDRDQKIWNDDDYVMIYR